MSWSHWMLLLARDLGVGARGARVVARVGLRRGGGGLLRPPRHERTILGDRRVDQLIEDVVGRVADEPGVEHERVTIRLLEPADVTDGPDSIGARFDERHTVSFSSAARLRL